MKIEVNNCSLYFDVVGSGLVANGPLMEERPVIILLHGGPGFDHTTMKPAFNPLSDFAQLVYYDHRGQGRSDSSDPVHWHLDQWADDLRGLIDALGIEKPIVLGLSFGGFVAQNYAIRHPDRLHKLILASTVPRMVPERIYDAFEKFGDSQAREAAENFWAGPTKQTMAQYNDLCMPLYNKTARDPEAQQRTSMTIDVINHFGSPEGENWTFDYREQLKSIRCPTLITAGGIDPITPIAGLDELAECIPKEFRQYEVYPECGHGVHRDTDAVFEVIKKFVSG
jgi:proline-specific peptidase